MPPESPKEVSIYANHGLHKGVSRSVGRELTDRFTKNPANGTREGYFLGIEFLRELVADLDAGQFDGLLMSFGESLPEDGATVGDRELVATQLMFRNATSDRIDCDNRGLTYTSAPVAIGTEPSTLGSPPA